MKILGVIFFVLICLLQYRIWWGEGSYREINELKTKIAEQQAQNRLLKEQNELLKKEILALRKNPAVLEEKAREQLGLIKPGETFYRVIPKEK
ncbi:FtsB family cell division protein [Aliikangiella coralliicola]|uniref:Cell division protein FtsB n=1 Tax=Aliikangiella coralliicola TaxID=2592383 RepID=A0A545TSW5_9GAMM|nr:septum formation initiator family protein [Aliikangiella coralliicola]TQV80302.1 cell division protein FtsB [Aliikangiella coralliicola]